jgi:hypothetical protein
VVTLSRRDDPACSFSIDLMQYSQWWTTWVAIRRAMPQKISGIRARETASKHTLGIVWFDRFHTSGTDSQRCDTVLSSPNYLGELKLTFGSVHDNGKMHLVVSFGRIGWHHIITFKYWYHSRRVNGRSANRIFFCSAGWLAAKIVNSLNRLNDLWRISHTHKQKLPWDLVVPRPEYRSWSEGRVTMERPNRSERTLGDWQDHSPEGPALSLWKSSGG